MTKELISLFRVVFNTQKLLVVAWTAVFIFVIAGLQILIHSPDFHGVRGQDGPTGFWIGMDFLLAATTVWVFAGYLGFLLNSVQRRNWLRQLPISPNALVVGPYVLLLSIAELVYLTMPIFWSMGTQAHALPGTYLFVFFPFLTFYLIRSTKRPILWFATSLIMGPVLYLLFFKIVLQEALRPWWMAHLWSPWTQAIFLALTFGLAIIFDLKSKKALGVVALLLGTFFGLTLVRTPFAGMKPTICNDVVEHTTKMGTTVEYYLYTQQEYLSCKDR